MLKFDLPDKNPKLFMQSYLSCQLNLFQSIFYKSRESSLEFSDSSSFNFLTMILEKFKNQDYFKKNTCNSTCHISNALLQQYKNMNYNMGYNYKDFNLYVITLYLFHLATLFKSYEFIKYMW